MDRLDPAVRPTFQFVDLEIDPDATDYTGSVRIELQVIEPVDQFHLHADLREIESLILRDADTLIESRFEIGADGFVTVWTSQPLVPGPHTLAIDFAATELDFDLRAV